MRVAVIGCGYLGITTAACLAHQGHDVIGVDVDAARVAALSDGSVPVHEDGLELLVRDNIADGRLQFTASLADVAPWADIHLICVGTPQGPGGAADVAAVDEVVRQLRELGAAGTIVGRSTVPVGTARRLGVSGWWPEFLREGSAVADTLRPDRLVFGVDSPYVEQVLRDANADIIAAGAPVIVTDLQTAELIKISANAFLATKISFINAIAEVCAAAGADVDVLADALGHDSRIGRQFLNAGIGYGGGCLPKDVRALIARADELGADGIAALLRSVDAINASRRDQVVQRVVKAAGGDVAGKRVAILGAAFKPGTDDVRDSPALAVADALHAKGAQVRLCDPQAGDRVRKALPLATVCGTPHVACLGADVVVLATAWPEYTSYDPRALRTAVKNRRIVDACNALPRADWRVAGWIVC